MAIRILGRPIVSEPESLGVGRTANPSGPSAIWAAWFPFLVFAQSMVII